MKTGTAARLWRACAMSFAVASTTLGFASWNAASAAQLVTLHDFCSQRACAEGRNPQGRLLRDSATGDLIGTAANGGTGSGTVYRLHYDPTSGQWRSNRLHAFCRLDGCSDGAYPVGNLVMDVSGNLYGVTAQGGTNFLGVVFELTFNGVGYGFKILHSFDSNNGDGFSPSAGLTYAGAASGVLYDGESALYGTTSQGGAHSGGRAYELTPNGKKWQETVLYDFCAAEDCTDGQAPGSTLLVDQYGNLFGTTTSGGNGHGVVFELFPGGGPHRPETPQWTETVMHTFCSQQACADGGYNTGIVEYSNYSDGLIMDASGSLFGATPGGGAVKAGCCGVLFKIPAEKAPFSNYTVLYSFCSRNGCKDGANPNGDLLMDASGNLFGTTQSGGGHNIDSDRLGGGTVFKFSGGALTTYYTFCSIGTCLDGMYPYAGLATDGKTALYGTTVNGGPDAVNENIGDGTVFAIVK